MLVTGTALYEFISLCEAETKQAKIKRTCSSAGIYRETSRDVMGVSKFKEFEIG